MKKYIIYLFALGMFFSSCSDDFLEEDPKGKLTSNGFFKSASDLEFGLVAMYNKANAVYNQSQFATVLMGGDDVTTRTGSNKGPFREFDTFSATDANPWMHWGQAYACVWSANNVIVNYANASEASQDERLEAAGQAYFIRAMSYYYLVRVWNEIPLITDLQVNLEIQKSGPEAVYELIVQDLKYAEQYLPESWEGIKKGVAPTKGSAMAQLASVYLSMAGYPLKDEAKYALAAQKAKEVMDDAGLYGYRLLDDFADLWTKDQFNDEIVFGLFYDRNIAPWTWENGNMRAPLASKPEEEGGWDDYFSEINFFNSFPEGPRKDATFQTVIRPDAETTLDWTEGVQKHPYYKKMRDMNGYNPDEPWAWVDWWSSRTNIVIRYAEVLLIYAEAQAMSANPNQAAYDAINAVRNRAGLDDLPSGLSKLDFRDAVVMERSWEFAGMEINAARWYDLVRLERVEEAAQNRHESELPILNAPTKDDYFASIPIGEKLINPNL
ncbi:RagB/SusD family nutrient uptake outer membrane protein [Carboxylicivirga sp. N1Y90]|uniref:RagB/SusD family nutrient uptake outer membrane protein n=1 Tax=Carboxylicivirga fragile TaxID=3417571 RepID=UPI003D34E978|nr:RagB/SusD family nutrient uptake outer membrane protein [Marinilabiliaceae bacterium N1Y90]